MGLETTKENIDLLIEIRDTAEEQTKLFPHVIPMLKKLKEQKIKTGLISNSSIFAIKHIKQKTNLLKFIDIPLFSFDVRTIKQDPLFLKKC